MTEQEAETEWKEMKNGIVNGISLWGNMPKKCESILEIIPNALNYTCLQVEEACVWQRHVYIKKGQLLHF